MTNIEQMTMHDPWPHQPPPEPPVGGYPSPQLPMQGVPQGFASDGQAPAAWPGVNAPPPRPPTAKGGKARQAWIIGGAIAAAIVLLAGAFLIGSRVGREDAAPVSPTSSAASSPSSQKAPTAPPSTQGQGQGQGRPSTTPPASPGSPVDDAAVTAEVSKLQRTVEGIRGLKFHNDVTVTVLSPADFKARALTEFDKETDQLKTQGQLLQALGLIPADADPVEVQKNLLGEGVLGFYDPITKALVVKGDKIGPFFREIVVHELTHALEDQQFNLNRPEIDSRTDGSQWAWQALVEGSARRVEYDYVRGLPAAEKQQLIDDMMNLGGGAAGLESMASVPLALVLIIQSPYDYGEPFVRDVLQRHGQSGLDNAFSDPPTTSEQILQPDKYESREGAAQIDKPAADGTQITDGTLGEIMTGFLVNGEVSLDDLLGKILGGGIDPEDPSGGLGGLLGGNMDDPTKLNDMSALLGKADKVKNWGADKYVLYTSANQTCVKVDWTMDSQADTQSLRGLLNEWSRKDGKAKVESIGDKTRVTRCIPSSRPSSGGNTGRQS